MVIHVTMRKSPFSPSSPLLSEVKNLRKREVRPFAEWLKGRGELKAAKPIVVFIYCW